MAKILLIEDEPQVRALLHEALQEEGHTVMEAGDGLEGLRLFRQAPADLVVTDIIMPDKEGLETIRELRRNSSTVKIIAYSGAEVMVHANILNLALKFGAQKTLTKPFELSKLFDAITEVLGTA